MRFQQQATLNPQLPVQNFENVVDQNLEMEVVNFKGSLD